MGVPPVSTPTPAILLFSILPSSFRVQPAAPLLPGINIPEKSGNQPAAFRLLVASRSRGTDGLPFGPNPHALHSTLCQ